LLWRDYFLFISRKYGRKLFTVGGFEEVTDPRQSKIRTAPGWWHPWNADAGKNDKAIRFVEGRTGVPFIDANIVRLPTFIPNLGTDE
jgi:deoxyribodipyrimidine photo-lyase